MDRSNGEWPVPLSIATLGNARTRQERLGVSINAYEDIESVATTLGVETKHLWGEAPVVVKERIIKKLQSHLNKKAWWEKDTHKQIYKKKCTQTSDGN